MVFDVVVMRPIYLNVNIMNLEITPVILSEILELAVVIHLFIVLAVFVFHNVELFLGNRWVSGCLKNPPKLAYM